jgi:methyl-accepting chemotaxis protein
MRLRKPCPLDDRGSRGENGGLPVYEPPLRMSVLRACFLRALGLGLLLALSLPAHAAEPDAGVRVLDGWLYRWGDPPQGAAALARESGEGWQSAEALRTPPGRGGQRLLWLSLPLPEGPWASPGLLLESVSNVVEVYVDGVRVHASGTLDPEGYEAGETAAWQVVSLPRSALGKRVLLRIQSSGSAIGVRGDVRVGERDVLRVHALRTNMDVFVIGALLLMVGAAAMVFFLLQGRQRPVGALVVFSVGTGLVLTLMSGVPQALWGVGRGGYLLMLTGAYFAAPGLCDFLRTAVLRDDVRWRRLAVRGLYAFALLASLVTPAVEGSLPRVFPLFLLVMLASLGGCLVLSVRAAARGNPDARLFVAGLGGVVLSGTLQVLTSFSVLESMGFALHWGLLLLTVSLVAALARRGAQVVRDLHAQTATLRAQQLAVQGLAEQMGGGAAELAAAVGLLRSSSSQQSEGVERQAAALVQAQTTVEEIRQTSYLTAMNAMQLAASTGDADEAGRAGLAAITHTLSGLEDIRREVSGLAQRILELEERTREASSIVETVQELADQSNLLAFNAALEASRGGEHGKGFAVVAQEMRSLANQSLKATGRIRQILEGVGRTMTDVAGESSRGEERVRQSVEALRVSGEQLQRIAVMVGETGGSVRSVTAAVAQQDMGIQQISSAIAELSEQMQRTLGLLRETESVTHSVEQLAQSMSGTAGRALAPKR